MRRALYDARMTTSPSLTLSQKVRSLKPSSTVAVSSRALELQRAGVDIISMAVGEPDFDTPPHVIMAAKAAMDAGKTRYTAGQRHSRTARGDCRQIAARERPELRPRRRDRHQRRQAGAVQRLVRAARPRRRGADSRAVLGQLPGDGAFRGRRAGGGADHAGKRLPARRGRGAGGHHPAHQDHHAQQPRQPDGSGVSGRDPARPGRHSPRKKTC